MSQTPMSRSRRKPETALLLQPGTALLLKPETALFLACRKPHVVNAHVQVQAQLGNRVTTPAGNRIVTHMSETTLLLNQARNRPVPRMSHARNRAVSGLSNNAVSGLSNNAVSGLSNNAVSGLIE